MLRKATALLLAAATNSAVAQTAPDSQSEWLTLVTPGDVSYTALNDGTVVLRATVPDLPPELVRYVAEAAQPTRLDAAAFPAAGSTSASNVIAALCGSDGADNRASFLSVNGLSNNFDFNAPLGDAAFRYQWPACFFINPSPIAVTARKDDQISGLFLKLTGWAGDKDAWTKYFDRPEVASLKPGDALVAPYLTKATPFRPRADTAEFVERVNALARSLEARRRAREVLTTSTPAVSTAPSAGSIVAAGEIILAKSASEDETSYSPPYDCRSTVGAPFNLELVRRAYARSASAGTDNGIAVTVADNGFFGARQVNGELTFSEKFASRVFNIRQDTDGGDTVGVQVGIGDNTPPLNPLNSAAMPDVVPDAISGHGTHVAGLILGGDTAGLGSGLFDLGENDAWLKMTIVPLSDGKRFVSRTALSSFVELKLQDVDITNFSVKYGPKAEVVLRDLVEEGRKTLFVVAAGNNGRDVMAQKDGEENIFPAAFGGTGSRNVVTVAAEDGSGNLTDFTNHSPSLVDIAAPGCNIPSWLDGANSSPLSGTSQAAPLVTFTAALLSHRKLTPYQIKRRIMLSGDILAGRRKLIDQRSVQILPFGQNEEIPILSMSRLNIPKALLISEDYVSYWEGEGPSRRKVEILGKLEIQGLVSCGEREIGGRKLLAGKRGPDERFWCFWVGQWRPLRGRNIDNLKLAVTVVEAIGPDGKTDESIARGQRIEISPAQLQEFIRSNRNMDVIMGEGQ